MIIFNQAMKRIFQNKTRLLLLVVLPILFILMFTVKNETSLTIGVVDKDHSVLSEKLISNLKNMYKVNVLVISEDTVYDKAVSYQTDYSIIIQQGFQENLMEGKAAEIEEFYLSEKEKLFYARSYISNYIDNIKLLAKASDYNKTKFEKAFEKYNESNLYVSNKSADNKRIPEERLAMGFLVQFMLYMSVITAGIISEDKSSGVFYRVFYAPVALKRYLFENLGAFLVIGISQAVLILLLLQKIMGFSLGNHPLSMYILFIVFSFVCISLGLMLVSLFSKPMNVYFFIGFMITPLVMLGGCYWPKEMMPDPMIKIAQFLPTTWIMTAVDKLLSENKDLTGISFEIFVLVIFFGIFTAAGLFKKIDVSK